MYGFSIPCRASRSLYILHIGPLNNRQEATHTQWVCAHKPNICGCGSDLWPCTGYTTVSHSCLEGRFDFMDLIHAVTMLGGFQNTVNDHFPACHTLPFHLIVSQRVSLHLLCSRRPSPSPPPLSRLARRFRSAVKYASLFSSVNWDPMFGQQWRIALLPNISILKNKEKTQQKKQLGLNKPPQGDWASRQQSIKKRKWTGINLAANLPFTAEQILIHDRDGKCK